MQKQREQVRAPRLTGVGVLTLNERPDQREVVAVFDLTPEQQAAYERLLYVDGGVRVTVEPAGAPATPPRPAEEIARKMAHVYGDGATKRVLFTLDGRQIYADTPDPDGLMRVIAGAIEQTRADGAAAALAAQQPRDLAGRIRALIQEKAGEWADAVSAPEPTASAFNEVLRLLTHALGRARAGGDVAECIENLRDIAAVSPARGSIYAQTADELEAIVRECEEKR